ncbi:MAG: NAD(P)/FAD-dependent oxidoreductase [Dongia sp.]
MADTYDAIVIGGGHNGLTTAAYLAMGGEKGGKNKLKVLVLERYKKVGGAAMSEEIYPGFTYSTCSYVCSLLRPEIFRFLDLPRHGLQVIPYEINSSPNPEGEGIITYKDHDRTRESLRRHSIKDAEAYDHYAAEISRQCRFIKPLLLQTPPDPTQLNPFAQNRINPWGRREDLDGLLKIAAEFGRMGEKEMYEIIRFWTMSIGDFLDEYFEHPRWKGFSAASSIIGTALGPYSPGTAYVLLHHYMGEVDGQIGAWGFARGGMGSVSKAIASAATEAGVEIRTNAEVAKIIVKGGRAVGVALANGEEIFGKTVVSNLDPKRTYLKLIEKSDLDAIDPDIHGYARNFKIRGSSGKLNIALDGLPQFAGCPKESAWGTIDIGGDFDYIEHAFDDYKYGSWSKRPFLDIVIPTTVDPTMAPPGKHFMSVFVQYVPYKLAESPWTPQMKAAFEKDVIDTIEENAPGFRNLILHCQTRTPWDIENEVGLTEGNIFQGELTLDQLLFNRPFPGLGQYRGPFDGFYMCGSGTHPGGGVMGAPGANAAREMLKDFKHGVIR